MQATITCLVCAKTEGIYMDEQSGKPRAEGFSNSQVSKFIWSQQVKDKPFSPNCLCCGYEVGKEARYKHISFCKNCQRWTQCKSDDGKGDHCCIFLKPPICAEDKWGFRVTSSCHRCDEGYRCSLCGNLG